MLDRDHDAVVEPAFLGQVHIDDFRESEPQQGKEQALRRLAQVGVFHRSLADYGGGVHGVAAVGQRRQVKHRIIVGQRVVAGVVAERPFPPRLLEVHVPFEHELGVRRDLKATVLQLHHVHRFAAQEPGERHLVDGPRHRGGGCVRDGGIGADGDGHFHPAAGRRRHPRRAVAGDGRPAATRSAATR